MPSSVARKMNVCDFWLFRAAANVFVSSDLTNYDCSPNVVCFVLGSSFSRGFLIATETSLPDDNREAINPLAK